MTEDEVREIRLITASLRHAYENLVNGTVENHTMFADGLISPAIKRLEKLVTGPRPFSEYRIISILDVGVHFRIDAINDHGHRQNVLAMAPMHYKVGDWIELT